MSREDMGTDHPLNSFNLLPPRCPGQGKELRTQDTKKTMMLPDWLPAYTLQDSLRSPACDLGDGARTQASPSVLLQTLEALALSVTAYCCFQSRGSGVSSANSGHCLPGFQLIQC